MSCMFYSQKNVHLNNNMRNVMQFLATIEDSLKIQR